MATKSTSIQFDESIERIKDELVASFGLKDTVSAGVLLLSRLDSTSQKRIVAEINGLSIGPLVVYTEDHIRKMIREEIDYQMNSASDKKSETYRQTSKRLLESVRVQLTPDQMDAFVKALGYDPKTKKGTG